MRLRSFAYLILGALGAWTACVAQAPRIDKIDPPGWWSELPSPMLLVHGESLDHAKFSVSGSDVALTRTQLSANGHWAFLWINTASAHPQTLQITAASQQGTAHASYVLAARTHHAHDHAGFSSSDVMYLIMTDRFAYSGATISATQTEERKKTRGWHGGNIAGIERHIDYLKQLGVTTVWTTPVASNGAMPDSYHGYAATDLYNVDAHFGTLADYRHLSDALHDAGMKLVIDLVPNHLGVQHVWINDPPAPEWLHGTLQNHHGAKFDFYPLLDPHAPESAWHNVTNGWFTDAMPDLNQENPLVSAYLIQNAIWWVETANLDGIRLDTFPYVGRAFWHDFHAALHAVYPQLTTVGEVFHADPEVASYFAGGVAHEGVDTGLDTPFDFPVYFALRDVLTQDKPMTELSKVLRQDALYPHPERLIPFLGNHDTTRFLTEAHGSVPRLKIGLALIATLRGMPQIYAGDEIGMTGGADPDNRQDFPGGFAGDARNAFAPSGRTLKEEEVFAWTASLLHLRAQYVALQSGREENLFADEDRFAFVRAADTNGCSNDHAPASRPRMLVLVNKSAKENTLELQTAQTTLDGCGVYESLAPAEGTAPKISNGKLVFHLAPESVVLYAVR